MAVLMPLVAVAWVILKISDFLDHEDDDKN